MVNVSQQDAEQRDLDRQQQERSRRRLLYLVLLLLLLLSCSYCCMFLSAQLSLTRSPEQRLDAAIASYVEVDYKPIAKKMATVYRRAPVKAEVVTAVIRDRRRNTPEAIVMVITATPTPSPTSTSIPTRTPLPTFTKTSTPLPATDTPIPPTAPPPDTPEPPAAPTSTPPPAPTAEPTLPPTAVPTPQPTAVPTEVPTLEPTLAPTPAPTLAPTEEPTLEPTAVPTLEPTTAPTLVPTLEPTVAPTLEPTIAPTLEPTLVPTLEPTLAPTVEPTLEPTIEPTEVPTVEPTDEPTVEPTEEPTATPTETPTDLPTVTPTDTPLPAPIVTDIVPPGSGINVTIVITGVWGENFQSGAEFILSLGGQVISATGITYISPTLLTGNLTIGDTPGLWDVTVINPDDQSGTLPNGFFVNKESVCEGQFAGAPGDTPWQCDNALGSPDGVPAAICYDNSVIILDLGPGGVQDGAGYDFYYYEYWDSSGPGVSMDMVQIDVSSDVNSDGLPNDPWADGVFIWGDCNAATAPCSTESLQNNGSISGFYFTDGDWESNDYISASDLHPGFDADGNGSIGAEDGSGIAIDIGNDDGSSYRFVRLRRYPLGSSTTDRDECADVDAIEPIH